MVKSFKLHTCETKLTLDWQNWNHFWEFFEVYQTICWNEPLYHDSMEDFQYVMDFELLKKTNKSFDLIKLPFQTKLDTQIPSLGSLFDCELCSRSPRNHFDGGWSNFQNIANALKLSSRPSWTSCWLPINFLLTSC